MWIIITLVVLAGTFWYMGHRWETSRVRPTLKKTPLVSILIPAYNSEAVIRDTIESAKNLDYKNKEIIVVNDSNDGTPDICKELGVRCIQNNTRGGKGESLNNAVKKAKGEILFFLDSDTTMNKDVLNKVVPWFSKKGIEAVAPQFMIKNRTNFLTRLIALEHQLQSALFKVHMFFGSMISFRGCGIAIRRSSFEKLGGWPKTLIEDTDFAGMMVSRGMKIQYEPDAIVHTIEPDSIKELNKQRTRWGKGTLYSFLHYKRMYSKNSQFHLYFMPYLIMILAMFFFFAWQTMLLIIPIVTLYLVYAVTISEFFMLFFAFFTPFATTMVASVATASVGHVAVITHGEHRRRSDALYIIPYIFFYFPMMMVFYARGFISGAKDKKRGESEVDFKFW
ncbi:MAG: glycosyltransferase family 2 protein [Candidatus Aenigmatarchaeota archaeon]